MVPVHTIRRSTIIIWNFTIRWHPGHTLFRCSLSDFKTCSSEQSNVSTEISAFAHLPFENEKEEIWSKIWIKSLSSQPSFYVHTHQFLSQFFENQPKFYHYVARNGRRNKFVAAEIIGTTQAFCQGFFHFDAFLKLGGPSLPSAIFRQKCWKVQN